MRKIIATALLALAIGGGAGYAAGQSGRDSGPQAVEHHEGHYVLEGPSCPTEDSCTIDYADGKWSVEEVTP